MDRTNLLGDIFKSVMGLQCMLDDKEAKVLLESVTTLLESELLPLGFKRPTSSTVVNVCEGVLESAANSHLHTQLPSSIDGIASVHYIGALTIYTMERPIRFYSLITFPLNVEGVRNPELLEKHIPFLKLLHVAMRLAAQSPEYLFQGDVFRGVKIEGNEVLKKKHANFMDEFKEGSRVCFAAPTSASTDPNIACQFTGGIQFVIKGVGGPGLPSAIMMRAGDLSAYEENEVLIESPSLFDVVARTKVPDGTVVVVLKAVASKMTYLSDSPSLAAGASSAKSATVAGLPSAPPELSGISGGVASLNISSPPPAAAPAAGGELTRKLEEFGMGAALVTILAALRTLGVEAVEDLKDLEEADAERVGLPLVHQRRLARLISHHKALPTAASPPLSGSAISDGEIVSNKAEVEARFSEALKLVGKDDAAALRLFRQAAERSHGDAQNYLGNYYAMDRLCLLFEKGQGQARDYGEAVKWFRLSAEQGNSSGQRNLGTMYFHGYGVQQDYEEAVRWVLLSAEQGNSRGQANLGVMYENGHGVQQDYGEAVKWYRLSAKQDNDVGQKYLGFMYDYGKGVQQDFGEAVKWYRLSAEQGNAQGQVSLGFMYEKGKGVEEDFGEAVKWYRLSAEQGNAQGQVSLGVMFEKGKGVQQDSGEAVKWFRLSAEQGNASGQVNLGVLYENGKGVQRNYGEAVKWYRLSAEQGNEFGQVNLGDMYKNRKGVQQDFGEAVKWYWLSAEQGNAYGQVNLGDMFENGKGVQQDYGEAVKWYRLSAEQGDASGQTCLGDMYENGKGVSKDISAARVWYQKAAAKGNHYSKNRLKVIGE